MCLGDLFALPVIVSRDPFLLERRFREIVFVFDQFDPAFPLLILRLLTCALSTPLSLVIIIINYCTHFHIFHLRTCS